MVKRRRGRKKVHKGENASQNGKQEKIDRRKELIKQHLEEVKWQAVDKILNEKGRKEREKEKKIKKEIEDIKAKEAAIEDRKKQALTKIHTKHFKDGRITLSFPIGFLLPKILEQKARNCGISNKRISNRICMKCGKKSIYCNPSSKNLSCSLQCYKELN